MNILRCLSVENRAISVVCRLLTYVK